VKSRWSPAVGSSGIEGVFALCILPWGVYTEYTMYVVRVMKSGHTIRISIPRDVQRHLEIGVGDNLVIELEVNGTVVVSRLDAALFKRGHVADHPSRTDRRA
jgi:bifunctional DNA-binding transcriptional regulator/antitoxin component of YhaV-PrlF toxin-antitoxin module